jgi:hypothetical protein
VFLGVLVVVILEGIVVLCGEINYGLFFMKRFDVVVALYCSLIYYCIVFCKVRGDYCVGGVCDGVWGVLKLIKTV